MNSIAQLAALPRRSTSAELRAHINQPLAPCAACGCPMFNVTHFADLHCADCGSTRLNNRRSDDAEVHRHVALRLMVVLTPDGRQVAEEFTPRNFTSPTKDARKC